MKIRKPIQQGTALVPCRIKGQNSLKKIGSIAGKVLLALLLILLLLLTDGDELEPVITLGLLLLFSLGGKEHGAEHGAAEESRGGLLI